MERARRLGLAGLPLGGESSKQRLLDAATAEFAAYGIAGARVDRIARRRRSTRRR